MGVNSWRLDLRTSVLTLVLIRQLFVKDSWIVNDSGHDLRLSCPYDSPFLDIYYLSL